MSLKNRDNKNRWRNKTVAFRVSPEEDAQIETAVRLSGLTKQDYITRRLLCREVVVQGNPRVYKALRNELAAVLAELQRIEAGAGVDEELMDNIELKPLLAKIVKVLRSLYRAYIDLKGKFDRLQGDYDRVREGNARLSDRLMEVKMENKKLRQISADYTRVKRVFGPEQVQAAVEADKQREQAEKGRKRPRRSLDRGGR